MQEYTFVVKRSRGRIEVELVTRQTSALDVIGRLMTYYDIAVDANADITLQLYWTWKNESEGVTVAELEEVQERTREYIKNDVYILCGCDAEDAVVTKNGGSPPHAPYGLAGAEENARTMLTLTPGIHHVNIYHHVTSGYPVRTIWRDKES